MPQFKIKKVMGYKKAIGYFGDYKPKTVLSWAKEYLIKQDKYFMPNYKEIAEFWVKDFSKWLDEKLESTKK